MILLKKLTAFALLLVMSLAFFGCGRDDGDLGKQTTVDAENGYTLYEGAPNFRMNDDEDIIKKLNGVKTDGFKVGEANKTGNIKIKADAVAIAKQEVDVKYNSIRVFYDRTRGIWKIVFGNDVEKVDENKVKSVETAVAETVYVDEDGYTLMTYMGEVK